MYVHIQHVIVADIHRVHPRKTVFRLVGSGIHHVEAYGGPDLSAFHDLVAGGYGLGGSYAHVVVREESCLLCDVHVSLLKADAERHVDHVVLLVDGEPVFYPVSVRPEQERGVVDIVVDAAPVQPSAVLVYQSLRILEVIDGDDRNDIRRDQLVNELIVEIDALLIYLAVSLGEYAGPCYGEAVGLEAHLLHQGYVFPEPVIVVAGDLIVGDRRILDADVHYRQTFAVLVGGAFRLERGGRCSPEKSFREGSYTRCLHGALLSVIPPCPRRIPRSM